MCAGETAATFRAFDLPNDAGSPRTSNEARLKA